MAQNKGNITCQDTLQEDMEFEYTHTPHTQPSQILMEGGRGIHCTFGTWSTIHVIHQIVPRQCLGH